MSISTLSPNAHAPVLTFAKVLASALCRRLLAVVLAAGILGAGYALQRALETPGQAIRHDLTQAAAGVAGLPTFTPIDRVAQTVSRYFPDYRASVDATGFPALVSVTLWDLDPDACRDALHKASRIEGAVVVAVEGDGDRVCPDRTALTWRIMP